MEKRPHPGISFLFCLLLALGLLKYVIPLVLPVLLGVGAALGLSPLVLRAQRRFGLGRGAASVLCVSGVLVGLILLGYALGRLLLWELGQVSLAFPQLLSALAGYGTAFGQWIDRLAQRLPEAPGDALRSWAQDIAGAGGTLASSLYQGAFSLVSRVLTGLPDILLFLLTGVLSCYFATAELPRLGDLCRELLPPRQREQLLRFRQCLGRVVGGYFRAQIRLMGITFLLLFLGLWFLGVSMPLLLALVIALLDALPLFGTGTVLLPWGLLALASGHLRRGLGLMALYALAALTRNVLEPRLLGSQLGISPLITLLAIYLGYRLSGVTGMLLLPLGVMLTVELFAAGRQKERDAS